MTYVQFGASAVLVAMLSMPGAGHAASPAANSAEAAETALDLFAAKNAGQVSVQLIPHDSKSGQVMITNNTSAPLTIKLPAAFAGVPILAQRRGGGAAGGLAGGGGAGGGSQGIGGGFGGGGGGFGGGGIGGGGGGGGFFNIGPERVVKVKFASVCLEHGKQEPSPRIAYDLIPIDAFTGDAAVVQLTEMLGRGEIEQSAAQAAVWHLANGLSWQQLTNKIGIKHIDGRTEPYFSEKVLQKAQQVAQEAHRRAHRHEASGSSPGYAAQFKRQ